MKSYCRTWNGTDLRRIVFAAMSVVLLVSALPLCSWARNPYPPEIRDIEMGASLSSVVDMIKGSGSYDIIPPSVKQRPALIWSLKNNPIYEKVTFRFTEKDRLFIIRLKLKKISRREIRAIEKEFFKKYGISWDNPLKLKTRTGDALNYGPPQMGEVYCFELTNRKTGRKALEFFDRVISSEDRPLKKKDDTVKGTATEPGQRKTRPESKRKDRWIF